MATDDVNGRTLPVTPTLNHVNSAALITQLVTSEVDRISKNGIGKKIETNVYKSLSKILREDEQIMEAARALARLVRGGCDDEYSIAEIDRLSELVLLYRRS
jgi:hypothetical protein